MLLSAGLAWSGYSQGQEVTMKDGVPVKAERTVVESTDRYRVVTNKFWGNWFIGAGAGAQMYFGDHNKQMDFGDRLSPAFNFYVGKWFTPGIGLRAGAGGLKFKGVTQNGAHSTGERYEGKPWDGYWLQNQEIEYYHIHGDVLFNLMNIFGGYRENRFYTLSPYVGLGWMVAHKSPKAREISGNVGLFNSFRLGKVVDLTLDFRGSVVNDRFDGELGGRREEGLLTGTLGLVFNLGKKDWDKPTTTTVTYSYDDAALAALRDRVNALSRDNDALRAQLANAKSDTITDIEVRNKVLAAPILVTFPISKSTVNREIRVNLGFFAEVIKTGNKDVVYQITGYADKGTGTPKINERLSRERAQAVYNVLVNEFDVDPSQLELAYEGGVDNMFYNDPHLSRAVITIAK